MIYKVELKEKITISINDLIVEAVEVETFFIRCETTPERKINSLMERWGVCFDFNVFPLKGLEEIPNYIY